MIKLAAPTDPFEKTGLPPNMSTCTAPRRSPGWLGLAARLAVAIALSTPARAHGDGNFAIPATTPTTKEVYIQHTSVLRTDET